MILQEYLSEAPGFINLKGTQGFNDSPVSMPDTPPLSNPGKMKISASDTSLVSGNGDDQRLIVQNLADHVVYSKLTVYHLNLIYLIPGNCITCILDYMLTMFRNL